MPLTTMTEEKMTVINEKFGNELLPPGLWFKWKDSYKPGEP